MPAPIRILYEHPEWFAHRPDGLPGEWLCAGQTRQTLLQEAIAAQRFERGAEAVEPHADELAGCEQVVRILEDRAEFL